MMRLKKLVLQGYKTFASRTEFLFDEGITAIVGPNGSGKSNIADALRWVLGEQSYGVLRGKRTTDMIFAGSQKRPRAGMAQAILTLDNSDGWLPIDYTEVEIGRRAYRSGENEYLLNGQKVRLKDITELLATSGLAERTYTIIGQGLIDKALSLKADERRALFEEAAGISHYKSRRAETLRRLQETQRNLERVHDILSEIKPRLTSLKRQATRAQNYEQLTADLHHALRIWYGYRWEKAKRDLRLVREEADAAEAAWKASRQQQQVRQINIDDLRRKINRLQNQINENDDEREAVRQALEKSRREAAVMWERRASLERQLADIAQELPPLTAQRAQAAEALEHALADLSRAQETLAQAQGELKQFNASFEVKQAEINKWQKALRQYEQERAQTQNKVAQAEGQLSQLEERLKEQAGADLSGLEKELAEIDTAVSQATAQIDKLQKQQQALEAERTALANKKRDQIRALKQLRKQLQQSEHALNKQRRDVAKLETRVEMLDQMRQKAAIVPENAQIVGTLASFMTIPEAYETAVSAALGSKLAALAVQDETSLWALIQHKSQTVSAAVLGEMQPPPQPDLPQDTAVIGWASSLITVNNPDAAPFVQAMLGTLLLVEDAQTAYTIAKQLPPGFTAVSPDGIMVQAGGLVQKTSSNADNILARENEWRQAAAQLAKAKEALSQAEAELEAQRSAVDEKQTAVDDWQTEESRINHKLQSLQYELNKQQREIDRLNQQKRFKANQLESHKAESQRLQNRIEQVKAFIASQQEEIVRVETAVNTARATLQSLPIAEATQQRQTLSQQIDTAKTIVAGRQAVVDSRRATLNQVDRQLARLQERQNSLQKQLDTIAQDTSADEQAQLESKLERLEQALRPLRQQLTEYRQELQAEEDALAVMQKENHDKETLFTQTRINLSQKQTAIEGLQERIKADLGIVALHYDEDQTGPTPLPMNEVVEPLPLVEELPEDLEETIQSLRGQIQRMGAINPDAPAEYEETQERFEFLTQQVEDLTTTEKQLRDVIAELDDLTSKAFAETVEKVDAVFGETFKQLFGGGNGRLVLTDPDDLTISGVDIIARLPNKREQGLSVLSGGERSLTAAALIFSLLKVSPTPFCVMDEVDAALDEANINRFRDLLRELSIKTQFIVITHNRGTVQAAQTIYGISMGPDSASQGISIKPEDYLKQKELL